MFVDIHSHIIPALDDGAKDKRAAVEMMRLASIDGTTHIVATPHYISGEVENNSNIVHEKCRELQKLAGSEGIDLTIYSGSEVFISPDVPELFDKGIICTINDSSYILIELPMAGIPLYTDDVLYRLQLKGLIPIIAHPERNRDIQKNPGILLSLVKRGILAQVNSSSITGVYGRRIHKVVMNLIEIGLIQFVASDAHTIRGRSPKLLKSAAIVQKEFGQEMVDSLFYRNGMTVLENGNVPVQIKDEINGFEYFSIPILKSIKTFFKKKGQ